VFHRSRLRARVAELVQLGGLRDDDVDDLRDAIAALSKKVDELGGTRK
jgi:hypothetical protein